MEANPGETRLRVFIIDDSTVFRSQLRAALSGVEWIEVAGFASNGRLGLDALRNKTVDVIVLDLEMPEMGGLEVLRELKRIGHPGKVIIFSAHSKRGAEDTLQALSAGADDFLAKPSLVGCEGAAGEAPASPAELIRSVLLPRIAQFRAGNAAGSAAPPSKPSVDAPPAAPAPNLGSVDWKAFLPRVVVIASSTGGPNALEKLFSFIRPPLQCPILIAQHMPPVFTATLAERLAKISGIPVAEAVDGAPLLPGRAFIAPGDYHLRLATRGEQVVMALDRGPQRNEVRPSADHLFESTASIYRNQCLGIVLTGMGSDGRDGAVAIKKAGGAVVIQSRESCVVFGMPGAVFAAGAQDGIYDLRGIAGILGDLGVTMPGTRSV